ncbi:MAG: FAD-binding oxidoreductase [Alphaproteobacteria bacterium]|nr:MAG: FAD-binding oxidoreductase [Alphaproteobacteria bacterium]
MSQPTAVVLGGGCVGAASAWALQRAGVQTRWIDRGEPERAASFGNAGHIATEQIHPLASLETLISLPRQLFLVGGPVGLPLRHLRHWLPFGLRLLAAARPSRFQAGCAALKPLMAAALPAWGHLAQEIGAPELLRTDGHFAAFERVGTAAEAVRAAVATEYGYATARIATAEELALLRARFANRPTAAVRFANTGQVVDLSEWLRRLGAAFSQAGGITTRAEVLALTLTEGRATALLDTGEQVSADHVVVAAGIGSAALLQPLVGAVPLIAERGYHLDALVSEADWPRDLPPVAFPDRSTIVTRFAHSLRMTGFTEFAVEGAAPDPRKWTRLEAHATALGLAAGSERRRWVGCRPTLPDYLPAIGRSRVAGNLLYAFGHNHLGVTLSAITGRLVADLACGRTPAVPLAPFDLHRF